MINFLINILITLIFLGIIAGLIYHYLPVIDEILREKLRISLFRKTNIATNQPLLQVFYKFNHKSSADWCKWIVTQDEPTQERAFTMILEHLDSSPANWGAATVEAVFAISKFGFPEASETLIDFLETSRQMWPNYKVVKPAYLQALKGLIEISPEQAIEIIKQELDKPNKGLEDIGKSIIDAMLSIPEEHDVADLYIQIITNSKELAKVRQYGMMALERKDPEYASKIYKTCLEIFMESELEFNEDDGKIYESLFHDVCKEVNDETFAIMLKACNSTRVGPVSISCSSLIIQDPKMDFNPEQLFTLYKLDLDEDSKFKLEKALSKRFSLNQQELTIIKSTQILKKHPFQKGPIIQENLVEVIDLPSDLDEKFARIKECLTPRLLTDEKGEQVQGGSVLIAGQSEKEKLYIARSIAAQRKWALVFGICDEVLRSPSSVKRFLDTIQNSKPCLVFIEDISSVLKRTDDNFVKSLKQHVTDPMIFLVGTLKLTINLEELKQLPPALQKLPRDLFPIVEELELPSEKQREKIIQNYIAKLNPTREQLTVNTPEIIKKTEGMSSFEFNEFISEYFKVALLVFGKLIEVSEFEAVQR
jgi:hypothetical protein